jgi:hypothetical protein
LVLAGRSAYVRMNSFPIRYAEAPWWVFHIRRGFFLSEVRTIYILR